MKKYLKLLRVKQYIKNALILLPFIFGKQLLDVTVLPKALWGIVSFCFFSSAVYIFNDLCDVNSDKNHPIKSARPLASGAVSRKTAKVLAVIMTALGAAANCFAAGRLWAAWALPAAYLALNILYSVKLKHIPVVDIIILISGYWIRVAYACVISGRTVSLWLHLTVIAVSGYLVLGKRYKETTVVKEENATRSVLKYYSPSALGISMVISLCVIVLLYFLWSISDGTTEFFGNNAMVLTSPLVALICLAYHNALRKSKTDDPVEILFGSKLLLLMLAVYAAAVAAVIYFI